MENINIQEYGGSIAALYNVETAEVFVGMFPRTRREVPLKTAERALERILKRH